MYIKQLLLRNFRNYESLDIPFENKVNVIIGENAQGKTNILESIYVLAFTKSYRAQHDRELIFWEKDFAKIHGMIHKNERNIPLEIIFHKNGKKAKKNKIEQKRLSEYIGDLNVVMFAPEDLSLVKGSPSIRRRFIDMELGQIEPTYLYHLAEYQKILKQRNHLLKQIAYEKQDKTLLAIYTEQLMEHAVVILEKRFHFLQMLKDAATPIHATISRQLEQLEIIYECSININEHSDKETIQKQLEVAFQQNEWNEIKRGTTLFGPHRDDLAFYINHKNVKLFGSQGQQRTTALSLKLAEIDLIYKQTNQYPILLLDDVLSELDDFRQSHLLDTIQGKVQTFVSTTNIEGIHHETIKKAALYDVHNGQITKR